MIITCIRLTSYFHPSSFRPSLPHSSIHLRLLPILSAATSKSQLHISAAD